MSAIVPHLDHVVINVADGLDASELLFRRFGFNLTARGHHSLGSSNHLAIFNDNYLELLGYEDAITLQRKDLWQAPLGLNGLVWKTADAEEIFQHLSKSQLADSAPTAFYRAVRLNDGTEPNARFKTVPIAAARISSGRSFFCQHLTPELVWRAEWQTHSNAVSHISEFVIVATDIQQAAQVYTEIFGQQNLRKVDENELSLLAGRARVRFISPQKAQDEGGIAPSDGIQSPKMVGVEFATHSLEAARQSLQRGDIHFIEKGQRIIVQVGHGLGLTIAFAEV